MDQPRAYERAKSEGTYNMSDIAIRAEGLSKQYRIGGKQERYSTLRDTISSAATAPFRLLRTAFRHPGARRDKEKDTIWALKDVSFEVQAGEVVGIIGANGAGKSTLLKILSRITEPTLGYAEIHGRVGSLLEVGTGFHQELTGRENVYLNGAILGMKRSETDRKFDEIVAFAEVEKFIDTVMKHYSSGMYLRLAFSVAAHLEPEILLVDEVLAVGDIAFQKKCLGKMEDVAVRGRTVLFVSHNLGAIKELCRTSMVIKNGRLDFRGDVVEGLARYSQNVMGEEQDLAISRNRWHHVGISAQSGPGTAGGMASIEKDEPFLAEACLDLKDDFVGGPLFCIITNSIGEPVVHQRIHSNQLGDALPAGRYRLTALFPGLWLAPGVYTLYFKFIGRRATGGDERYLSERVMLDIAGSTWELSGAALAPPANWTLSRETDVNGEGSRLSETQQCRDAVVSNKSDSIQRPVSQG
jgi:lipopolysaccharide transport system ATP-binding protein